MFSGVHRGWLLAASVAVGSFLVSGCGGPASATSPTRAATEPDSSTVTPLGSWVPRKVKKKSDATGVPGDSADAQMLERAQRTGATKTAQDPR